MTSHELKYKEWVIVFVLFVYVGQRQNDRQINNNCVPVRVAKSSLKVYGILIFKWEKFEQFMRIAFEILLWTRERNRSPIYFTFTVQIQQAKVFGKFLNAKRPPKYSQNLLFSAVLLISCPCVCLKRKLEKPETVSAGCYNKTLYMNSSRFQKTITSIQPTQRRIRY